ncbi:CBS domain-containing protein [candidate division KSB1 bacterium]|nr:CBS domain-containing protein [candidate division KSB1 bacterium]NIR70615.1 CBS domain-containing protein [candidate division KSB1 bacterium]NIS24560.1 CBS domain-containing protein [candidate division KSB1 bacterium]NIT71478.1 CBS domain-containing protein [candidate division KSB1 bacterium]NIU25169.1 CBS domain-containing protein [candidate division KSB1 bacterium]
MINKTAKDIMNTDVMSVQGELSVHELAEFFTENMISGAPVVDEDGRLIGVVSLSDIVRNDSRRAQIVRNAHQSDYYLHGWEDELDEAEIERLHVEEDDGLNVRDIMTPLVFKVSEETPISQMADTMIGGRIHRLIVTRDDQVVGIVTTLDMLKAIRDLEQSEPQLG